MDPSSIDVTETDPRRDWSYLSEGGASMVFSYTGPSHPTYNGTVLRLRKSLRHAVTFPQLPPHATCSQGEEDDPSIGFQGTVISHLIPSVHLPRLQSARVSFKWLKELEGITDVHRPVERTLKDGIDISRCNAVLATDLVGGKGWAVEIKPKWAFLPSPEYLSSWTRPLKLAHCRFCMHTHLRSMGQGPIATNYCPLDFFSGDEMRVRSALRNLWEAWVGSQGKGNNLCLFDEGKIVNPKDACSLSSLATKLLGSNPNTALPSTDLLPPFINAVLPLILHNPLVSILAHLQRTLDPIDIEGLSQLWSCVHTDVPLGQGETDPTPEEWDNFIRTYLSGGNEALRYNILAYLLSATFKDCSIILRPHSTDNTGRLDDTITVIDLDPKSVTRLSKWEVLDREIVRSFADVADDRTVCIDARKLAASERGGSNSRI